MTTLSVILRRHGPFEPHRLPLEELEYTTMPELERRIADRWEPMVAPAVEVGDGRRHVGTTAGQ